jgi:hypothetical protein
MEHFTMPCWPDYQRGDPLYLSKPVDSALSVFRTGVRDPYL